MFLCLKAPYKTIFSINFAQIALAAFAIFAGLVASGSVFLNDLYFWRQSGHYINPYLCLIAFLLAFSPRVWGLTAIIFLLPLSAGLGTQLNAYLGTQFLILPNAGLDLVAGFFLGSALTEISKYSHFLGKNRHRDLTAVVKELVPWPITLVIAMITISTAIAISRNVYQSAAATSFKGLLFNLVHFRPIGWHDDYMPISDWIAYALAVAMIILVIGQLKGRENKNQIIFRPVMAGLIIASLMGILQAITGLGLPENLLNFRKDHLGYAVIGFQPDLHAFAGHMLLGAVGLWGYFYSGISRHERKLVALVVALCWVGLILSKSRALLLIAIAAMLIWLIWSLWQKKSHIFLPSIAILAAAISIFVTLIFNYSNSFGGIPVLSWLGELANEFKSRDLTSWSLFSGIFGSRFEIWEAAIRMWWEFPLMGIGQGNFYRLSDIASFSKSHFLILNRGENAHNYFLQTLTETGIVGTLIIATALVFPLIAAARKILLLPAIIALGGLFLGNIFSHSFLVRENLLFASIFFGLMFIPAFQVKCLLGSLGQSKRHHPIQKNVMLVVFMALGSIASMREVYLSFNMFPFEHGRFCFINSAISQQEWTSGQFEVAMPAQSKGIKIFIIGPTQKNRDNLTLQVAQINDGQVISINYFEVKSKFVNEIDISAIEGPSMNHQEIQLRFTVSQCFVPRNQGVNVDGRRLGVFLVHSVRFL